MKTAAKELSSCPQRCVEGQQVLMHNCTDSSVQLINSSPMYMSSNVSDSHIIAVDKTDKTDKTDGGLDFEGISQPRAKCQQKCRKKAMNPFTFFRTWSQSVKPSALLLYKSKDKRKWSETFDTNRKCSCFHREAFKKQFNW